MGFDAKPGKVRMGVCLWGRASDPLSLQGERARVRVLRGRGAALRIALPPLEARRTLLHEGPVPLLSVLRVEDGKRQPALLIGEGCETGFRKNRADDALVRGL